MTSFKQFIREDATEKLVHAMARKLLGVDNTSQLYGANVNFDKMLSGAKEVSHKFIDTVNGPWNAKLYSGNGKNKSFVVVAPPKGSGHERMFIVPSVNESVSTVKIDDVIRKLASALGSSISATHAYFIGGSAEGMTALTSKLEKDGYDTAGAWEENKGWFKKHGITKAQYDTLVAASL